MMRMLLNSVAMGLLGLLLAVSLIAGAVPATAGTAAEIDKEVALALEKLYAASPAAVELAKVSKGVLVFPDVVKAGLIIGGQYGEGVLLRRGKPAGYYSTAGASYGLQAGAQQYGYAMFFMSDGALKALTETDGFEVGVGPNVVVVDEGMGRSATTMTMKMKKTM